MKVYTRGGDRGETSLGSGERVGKDHPRIEACGAVDELNAVLGLARAEITDADLLDHLGAVQSSLFDLGSELACSGSGGRAGGARSRPRVEEADVRGLESWIDRLEEELEPLRSFVLPGGTRSAARLHLARTVCRRAERRVVTLGESAAAKPEVVRYLNRLSDLLFVMARVVNRRAGVVEPRWPGSGG